MNRAKLHGMLALCAATALGSANAAAQAVRAQGPLAESNGLASGPCLRARSSPRAPIELSFGIPGVAALSDFGSTPSACGFSGFSIGGRMGLLVATSAFYGAIDAEASLSGTYRIDDDSWITLGFDAVRYRTVINASVVTAPVDFGATTLTVHHVIATDDEAQVTLFLRALLPTELSNRYAARLGVEPGFSVAYSPHRRWTLHGGISIPVSAAVSAAGTHFTFTPRASLDVAWLPIDPFELLLGLEARAGLDGLEYLSPRLGLRVHATRRLFIDLSAMAPLLGLERTLARASLTAGMRW
ncbi:MAG: hypothetical protein U0269_23555 [Polyangiales bacterium]